MQGRRSNRAPNLRLETPLPHHSRTSCNYVLTSEIVAYGFWMRKEGYSETTIERYVRLLKELAKHGDLRDSESVKIALTRTGWADGTKEMACGAYAIYAKQHGFTFAPPRYGRVEKFRFHYLNSRTTLPSSSQASRLAEYAD